jgi:AcrR family transcriptional regulator
MPARKRQRLSVEERRRQLLEVGAELLSSADSEHVSVEGLAKAAGISTGLLYHYFPSKQDFLLALTESLIARTLEATRVERDADAKQTAQHAIRRFLEYITEHRTTFLALHAAADLDPGLSRMIGHTRDLRVEQMLSVLGHKADESPLLRAALSAWVLGAEHLCLQWAASSRIDKDQLESLLLDTLWSTYTTACALESGLALTRWVR